MAAGTAGAKEEIDPAAAAGEGRFVGSSVDSQYIVTRHE